MFNSTPMPGEDFEKIEAQEKARLEQEAIANGENFNPNLSEEAAAGFESLGDDVPFAGDTTITRFAQEKHDSDNAISANFNEQWDQGKSPNLDDIQESVERNYIDGAIEQSATNPDTEADIADTERNINDNSDTDSEQLADQPHDISEAAAMKAISTSALAEDLAEDIKNGDEDAISRIEEVEMRASDAMATADKINTASFENSDNNIEAQMATNVATEAIEKAQEAIETVNDAKSEYDMMTDEEKAETKAAAEAAEQNGTTVEEEKAKADFFIDNEQPNEYITAEPKDDEDDFVPDLSNGIFG